MYHLIWCNMLYAFPVPGNMQISFEIQMCKDATWLVYSQHTGCIMMKTSKNGTLMHVHSNSSLCMLSATGFEKNM